MKPVVTPVRVSASLRPIETAVEPTEPPEKPMDFRAEVPMPVVLMVNDVLCQDASWRA